MSASDKTRTKAQSVLFGPTDSSSLALRTVSAIHKEYANEVATALSVLLRKDLQVGFKGVSELGNQEFLNALSSPTCLMVFRLDPRSERMFLHLDSWSVFTLLELLLGGTAESTPAAERNLTEIEWSLLEEVVQVILHPLGNAWRPFALVQFDVESLISEPALLPRAETRQTLVRIAFDLKIGEQTGSFEIALPAAFFESARAPSEDRLEIPIAQHPDLAERAARLENAAVALEVRLEGQTVPFSDLMALEPDQVLTFNHPLDKPLRGYVDKDLFLEGQIVASGKKKAFKVVSLPAMRK